MWLLLAGLALVLAVLAHAVLSRIQRLPGNMVARFVAPAALVGLGLLAILLMRYGLDLPTLAALLLYGLGCEVYVFLFTMISSSVTVAILLRLESEGLTRREIDLLYNEEQMVAGRIARLVANGFLVATSSGYAVSDRGHVLLHNFTRLRRFFGQDQSETQP
jgi:hypothetical protein